jgi:hypothetical protein
MVNRLEYINTHPKVAKRMLGISYQDLQLLIRKTKKKHQDIQAHKLFFGDV